MTEHERMIEARHAEILQQLDNNRAVIDAVFVELQTLGDTLDALTKMAERLIGRSTRSEAPLLSDDLYEEARAAVVEAGSVSTAYLQRRLGVGYTRAAALLDQLEETGVIGPAEGAKPRRVLITPETASDA